MAIPYTKKMLLQRIRKYVANGFPNEEFSTSENELVLHIDSALAYNLVGSVYAHAKLEGNICMPEAYLSTFLLPALQQDKVTNYWYTTLPQTPISLPLGYSLDRVYFADTTNGEGEQVFLIKAHRVSYRKNMPQPFGVRAWVEGNKITLVASNGNSLLGKNLYVRMASTRTTDVNADMGLPPDAIETIFNMVVDKLTKKYQEPQDIIKDNLPSGNKTS